MATLHPAPLSLPLVSSSSKTLPAAFCRKTTISASSDRLLANIPNIRQTIITGLPRIFPNTRSSIVEELDQEAKTFTATAMTMISNPFIEKTRTRTRTRLSCDVAEDPLIIAKLHAIKEAVADRVEMHNNVCEQRNNWNSLLLNAINSILLAATTTTSVGFAFPGEQPPPLHNLPSTILYLSATALLVIMNKFQPSQLAEEQRNATRLFKNLLTEIETTLSMGYATNSEVTDAMRRVLALDKAYPLPLLGAMLEKFPTSVAPATWWPEQARAKQSDRGRRWVDVHRGYTNNGWSEDLEGEMREIVKLMKVKDKKEYLRLGEKALKLNKLLAIAGPTLAGIAAIGSLLAGPSSSWAGIVGAAAGAVAVAVNTLQHGGQVGMVFELYRGTAGFFEFVEESIQSTVNESDLEYRENGELFQMKLALMLGRNLSELRDVAAKSRSMHQVNNGDEEFASKLL
ncbi:unnamed protein product [Cuscuta epithymum]|uniref:F-box protein At4g22030 n=1 Tax=Cuscuta epithymum TaxID=186058 RepID=A0AAV0F5X4_9ASTE|nr:unnamed protein product [Cuscuta epithymum]